ncbi:hypothetical protein [Aestuariivirga sp.]|uniref:hypothetical protein n=1 Tax=Aestuariivirga sp. TaxID=2650926 RepID=UPI0039E3F740
MTDDRSNDPNLKSADVLSFGVAKAMKAASGNLAEIHALTLEGLRQIEGFSVRSLNAEQLLNLVERFAEFKLVAALTAPDVIAATQAEAKRLGRELTTKETMELLQGLNARAFDVTLK